MSDHHLPLNPGSKRRHSGIEVVASGGKTMGLTRKEANLLNESKAAVKAAWIAACTGIGVDPASEFVIFQPSNPLARTHNELMGAHFKLVNRIKRNIARRERNQAMKDLGLTRVVGAQGGVYFE